MTFFEIGEDGLVQLNKVWIQLIPEFNALYKRSKKCDGDYDGRKKLQARREFTYIYFYYDFSSPIREYEEGERHKESLYYAGIKEVDDAVMTAREEYNRIVLKATRSLRSYKAMLKSVDQLDNYFENLDFGKVDKKGELLNSPESVGKTIIQMEKVYAALNNFKRRVEEDMKAGNSGIRGTAELGDTEATDSNAGRRREWSEVKVVEGAAHSREKLDGTSRKMTFADLNKELQEYNKKEKFYTEEEIESVKFNEKEEVEK